MAVPVLAYGSEMREIKTTNIQSAELKFLRFPAFTQVVNWVVT
jgi:hypothetical protein